MADPRSPRSGQRLEAFAESASKRKASSSPADEGTSPNETKRRHEAPSKHLKQEDVVMQDASEEYQGKLAGEMEIEEDDEDENDEDSSDDESEESDDGDDADGEMSASSQIETKYVLKDNEYEIEDSDGEITVAVASPEEAQAFNDEDALEKKIRSDPKWHINGRRGLNRHFHVLDKTFEVAKASWNFPTAEGEVNVDVEDVAPADKNANFELIECKKGKFHANGRRIKKDDIEALQAEDDGTSCSCANCELRELWDGGHYKVGGKEGLVQKGIDREYEEDWYNADFEGEEEK